MKNKFCENCRTSVAVPANRVRAVSADLGSDFANTSISGFWNSSQRVAGR